MMENNAIGVIANPPLAPQGAGGEAIQAAAIAAKTTGDCYAVCSGLPRTPTLRVLWGARNDG
jgi:hypothetical protein